MDAFLLTYRSFTTPTQLLSMLIQRYNVTQINGVDGAEALDSTKKIIKLRYALPATKIHLIYVLRVGNVVKSWLEKYWTDFEGLPELQTAVSEFIKTQIAHDLESLATNLLRYLNLSEVSSRLRLLLLSLGHFSASL